MIECNKCKHYIFCNNRSAEKDYCKEYKQKQCKDCARFPFCEECKSHVSTCDKFKLKNNILVS